MKDYFVESCVVSLDQAVMAFQHGADRLEVCTRLETEGMTPEMNEVEQILNNVSIPVRVMIRETESGFESDDFILAKMILSIESFKGLPVDGFVIGLLQQDRIDREKMQKLINSALPFSVTIHKAIDLSSDPEADVKWMNQFENVDTILSSGGVVNAIDGVDQILKMKSWFKGEVMAGGKIRGDILPTLHAQLGLRWYHGRNIV